VNLVVGDRVRFLGAPGSTRERGSTGTVKRATGRDPLYGGLTYVIEWDDGDAGMTPAIHLERAYP
jgi:hypothetical protein